MHDYFIKYYVYVCDVGLVTLLVIWPLVLQKRYICLKFLVYVKFCWLIRSKRHVHNIAELGLRGIPYDIG